jgi:hypothetical protein
MLDLVSEFDSRYNQDTSSLYSVQTDSGVYPAFPPMGTGYSFPSSKATEAWNLQLAPIYWLDKQCVKLYLHALYIFLFCLIKNKVKLCLCFVFYDRQNNKMCLTN